MLGGTSRQPVQLEGARRGRECEARRIPRNEVCLPGSVNPPRAGEIVFEGGDERNAIAFDPRTLWGKREHAASGNMNWYQDSNINNAHLLTRQF